MKKASDYHICIECFVVFDKNSRCNCPYCRPEKYVPWFHYRFLNDSLPSIPKVGQKYPMPDEVKIGEFDYLLIKILPHDDLEETYSIFKSTGKFSLPQHLTRRKRNSKKGYVDSLVERAQSKYMKTSSPAL